MFARNQLWKAIQEETSRRSSKSYSDEDVLLPSTTTGTGSFTNRRKNVRFSETCRVILIPCLAEYRSLGLHLDMWWQEKDYRIFKSSAAQEISNLFFSFGGDVKSITKSLYQPDSDKLSLMGPEL